MIFELRTRTGVILPTDSLDSQHALVPPFRYGALIRIDGDPLFTADRGEYMEEILASLSPAFNILPIWGDGIATGTVLSPDGKPVELGRQGFCAPELPAVIEIIIMASGQNSDACKAIAGCSVNLFRELQCGAHC